MLIAFSLLAAMTLGLSAGLAAVAAPASAQSGGGIGVAPVFIEAENVLRGGTFAATIILSNESNDVDTEFTLTAAGDIEGWAAFTDIDTRTEDLSTVVLNAGAELQLLVVIDIPDDVVNGEYRGVINVGSAAVVTDATETNNGVGLNAQISVSLDVDGTEVRASELVDTPVDPAEVGLPQRFSAVVRNDGNVRVQPQIDIDIVDDQGTTIDTVTNAGDFFIVDGGTTSTSFATWDTTEQRAGDYTANITVTDVAGGGADVIGEVAVPFRLDARGTFTRSGTFTSLEVANQPEVGGEARLEAFFENSGGIEVQAIFTGVVIVDGAEDGTITSLPKVVLPNTIGRVDIVVPVDVEGEYTVEGIINFDGFESESLSVTFTPNAEGTASGETRATTSSDGATGDANGEANDDGGGSGMLLIAGVVGVLALVGVYLLGRRTKSGDDDGPPSSAAEERVLDPVGR